MSDASEAFFTELRSRGDEPMLRKAGGTLRFDITDGTREANWTVAMKKGHLKVAPTKGDADCVVTSGRQLFDSIVRGEKNAMAALLRGDVSVKGDPELFVLFQRLFPGPADSVGPVRSATARTPS